VRSSLPGLKELRANASLQLLPSVATSTAGARLAMRDVQEVMQGGAYQVRCGAARGGGLA